MSKGRMPDTPSSYEIAMGDIEAQLAALPKIYEAQKEYGGLFAQLGLGLGKEFGPQWAELEKGLQEELYPYQSGLGELLGKQATLGLEEYGVPEELEKYYLEKMRGGFAARGIGESPIAGAGEALGLAELSEGRRLQNINLGLNLSGRAPMAGLRDVSVPQFIQQPQGAGQLGLGYWGQAHQIGQQKTQSAQRGALSWLL